MLDKINSVNELRKKSRFDKGIKDYHETRGTGKLEIKKYAEAINDLSEEIQLNPKDFKLYFYRATLKLNFGDIEGARKDFKLCEMYRRNLDGQTEEYPLV